MESEEPSGRNADPMRLSAPQTSSSSDDAAVEDSEPRETAAVPPLDNGMDDLGEQDEMVYDEGDGEQDAAAGEEGYDDEEYLSQLEAHREMAIVEKEADWEKRQWEDWKKRKTILRYRESDRTMRIEASRKKLRELREERKASEERRLGEKARLDKKRKEVLQEREKKRTERELERIEAVRHRYELEAEVRNARVLDSQAKLEEEARRLKEERAEREARRKELAARREQSIEDREKKRKERDDEWFAEWKTREEERKNSDRERLKRALGEEGASNGVVSQEDHERMLEQKRSEKIAQRERERHERTMEHVRNVKETIFQ
eukprot:TRINITY_DN218_c0_g1_i1.p2 TRINITY_DN218_c0_g1~~TRINITY_DN218_c0_g1_i1.p2  ORF type:complete len:353 (+),score=121.26 TRINITY_DN218_c0_g1_i1:103-1059(+)